MPSRAIRYNAGMTTIGHPNLTVDESSASHRFTRADYYAMADAGIFKGCRVELIEGQIIDMAPQKDTHAVAILLLQEALHKAFPQHLIRCQLPLTLGVRSEPEPDFAVTAGLPRDFLGTGQHPSNALLVVEIADTTLRIDRGRKASLYARAGIRDYWIVNLRDGCIEVRREPTADAAARLGHRYKTLTTLRPPESISPLAAPTAQIPIADLLP